VRIRTVKPDFWEDEVIGTFSPLARLLFIGTWNLADDEGLLRWTADFVNASLFMYDDLSNRRVEQLMSEVVQAGMIFPYVAGVGRQKLAYIVHFRRHQKINRPQPGRFAPPSPQSREVQAMYGRRDGWRCHLCSGPINQVSNVVDNACDGNRNQPPSPDLNLALDHLVVGGGDHPSNIAAGHVGCTKERRDRPNETFVAPRSVRDSLNDSVNGALPRSPPQAVPNDVNHSLPSRAPADQGREGKGVPTSSGAAAPTAITAQTVAAAWIDACRDGTGAEPSRSQVGQVARLAKELLASNDAGRVLAAARSAGAGGFAAIDRELTAQAGRQRAAPTAWAPLPIDPTTGKPVDFR